MNRCLVCVLFAATALIVGCPGGEEGTDLGPADHGVQDPGITDIPADIPAQTGECMKCLATGMAFRFTTVNVTEPSQPEGLPEFLNAIWAPDISANRLNIMLRIDEMTDNGDGTKTLKFTAGSAWHDLTLADVLPVEGGTKTPAWFDFVGGSTSTFQAKLAADCTFQTIGATNLLQFHPGPTDTALICSAGNAGIGLPKDTIPIANLVATGAFNGDCTQVTNATLDGCIAADAACEICNFLTAPDYQSWSYAASGTPPKSCDAAYCESACGRSPKDNNLYWVNFGGFVKGLGVPTECKVGTQDAYKLKGSWAASKVATKAQ